MRVPGIVTVQDAITPVVQLRQAEGTRELEAEPLADLWIILAFLESTLAHQSRICIAYQASSALSETMDDIDARLNALVARTQHLEPDGAAERG